MSDTSEDRASLTAHELLGPSGLLSTCVDGFMSRQQQQEMAAAVEQALIKSDVLICEAGTGTGKTFAYLIPAILSGRKVIISTGTRNLQDQLYQDDIPVLRKALSGGFRPAILKGRSNYLCIHRLSLHADHKQLNLSSSGLDELEQIRDWAGRTRSGDIAEVNEIPERSLIWPLVTSTADNCLGQECPDYSDCFVLRARRKAQKADLVIINHHLFFADLTVREEGFGEVLPDADAFIMDEAHQLAEVASSFFGQSVTSRQIKDLVQDSVDEYRKEAGDMPDYEITTQDFGIAATEFRKLLGRSGQRLSWDAASKIPGFQSSLEKIQQSLSVLIDQLVELAPRGKGLLSCYRRADVMMAKLQMMSDASDTESILWVETTSRGFAMYQTPISIADKFKTQMELYPRTWIFTSATLAVGDNVDYFKRNLGIGESQTMLLGSPFDYQKNALLYLPSDMPEPNTRDYTKAVVNRSLPLLEASTGRAFILFTSHRALNEAAKLLREHNQWTILAQGEAPKARLLNEFREHGNAVLLGAASFWEGVDVRGGALSLVIIDKLPFASPGDPVMQARLDVMQQAGLNPFMDYQLPNAVIALKQGVGRLIRDFTDRGVMAIFDPRIRTRAYGKVFINSLPSLPVTQDLTDVVAFFEKENEGANREQE